MRTAVDTSVLLTIFKGEPDARRWVEALIHARREGQLLMGEVVYAELAAVFGDVGELEEALEKLGILFAPSTSATAWRAGRTFREYRDAKGPREHLIPDFLVAAHAITEADRLAAVDRGYLRRYFADLPLLQLPS